MSDKKQTQRCEAVDIDCAPPFQCELPAGHEGPHEWKRGETVKQFTTAPARGAATEKGK